MHVSVAAHLRFLPLHGKVEFILISVRCFLAEALNAVAFGVVIASTENIVLVLFERSETTTMLELRALLVVASMKRVSQRRHGESKVQGRNTKK